MENKIGMKVIDRDAIIKMEIFTGVIERLQSVGSFLVKEKTDEEMQKYYEEVKSYLEIAKGEKQFSEEWMNHYTTIVLFLDQIEKQADKQGLIKELPIEEYIKEIATNLEGS